jgi:hypothetical protein
MNELGHGVRLSQQEYERQITELYSGFPPASSKEEAAHLRRRELDLTIDHRLGQNFPQDRREALWEIQQRVEKKRLRLGLYWFTQFISGRWLRKRADDVAKFVIDEYAKVLTKKELEAYFGRAEVQNPSLPIRKV